MKQKINMHNWIQDVLSSKRRIAVPIMTHPGIEMMGNSIKEAVCSGDVHAMAIKRLNEVYPADATTVIMDLTVESEVFGSPIVFLDDDMPAVTDRVVSDLASVQALKMPTIKDGRIPEYLKANTLSVQNIDGKPIFAGMIGPFSLAGRLFDMSEVMMYMYIEPDTIRLLLDKCTMFLIDYAKALKATGVDGVVIAEPAAGLLSNEDANAFSSTYVKQIVDAVQDETFIAILHNCGNTGHCTDSMVKTGAVALSFGNAIDLVSVFAEVPSDVIVMGNLDPVRLFNQATPEQMSKATTDLLESTSQYRNFILSTGCDVPCQTPFENIEAYYDALRTYNTTR